MYTKVTNWSVSSPSTAENLDLSTSLFQEMLFKQPTSLDLGAKEAEQKPPFSWR